MKKTISTLLMVLLLGLFGLVQAQVSLPYTEGFEEGLGSWTLSNCHSSTGISTSTSYIHSGSQAFAFHWSTNPPQYLISPEITGATGGVNVEFYYKAGSSGSYSETFQVGYSTSTNAVGSFTFGEEITAPAGTDWALYSNTFPAGTKYVAVACTSYDALYFCVDDFTFTAAGGGEMLEAELTVHDATTTNNYVPVYGTWADAYQKCEMVYPASELSAMAGGEISGITYYLSSPASDVWTGTWEVFMYEVDNTTIDNFYGEDRSIVYTGALDGTGATMTINFDTPYTYNGGNLLVGVYQIVPGNWKSAYFYGETVSGASVQGYSSTGLDYISATQRNFLPKTTFSYLTTPAPCPDTAMVITPVDGATDIDEANTMLSWQLGNNTQQYCLLFGTDPSNMDTLVPWTQDTICQYLFNDPLTPWTTYYWQVGERNDGCPDGVFSEVWSFTTVIRIYTITATPNPTEGGSVTGADSYYHGTTCTLVATPNTGYRFINWTEGSAVAGTSDTLTFSVTRDRDLVANFELIQLDVFADYYPNPADSLAEIVRVYWEEKSSEIIEDFESGDFSKFNWQLDESYPWTITTNDPYEGSYCMKSGGSGVANMESIMTVTVDIPADGQMSFFCKISCESSWDYGYFYIDDAQMGQYTGYRSWEEKKFYITQGLHTFKWRYTKDNIGDYNDDCFYVDNITFYKSSEPIQPGWHTYCESDFNNAVGSNLTATPSWAYEYPTPFLKTNYAGWNITKVSLFSDNMYNAVGGNYTCNIYVGGAEPASGTMVSTITVDVPSGQNAWVDWDLTTPVNVTGNEPIWIVWTANTTVSSWPAGCCEELNDLGTWWNGGNGWEHLSYGTWTMRQYFDNGADKGFYSYGNESTRDLPNYRIYRALCNESDPTLLTDTVTVQEYLDNDWVSLDHGFYKYGVSIEDGPIYWSDSIKNIAVFYNINASVNPTEGGSVSGMGPQERHTTCSLVATNNTGYHFTNWTLNDSVVSTNNTLEVYVTQDSTFVAHFELNSYNIEASADPTQGGEITGTGTYHHFDECTLIATPLTGYHFVNWTVNDTEVSTSDTLTFTVTQDSTFVAHFELNSYEITASANSSDYGSVTGGGYYEHFSTCTLTATVNPDYIFQKWTKNGTTVSLHSTFSFTVTEDAEYVAHFNLRQYTINATANPAQGGTVTGSGNYAAGSTVTLEATANEGYTFVNWTKDGEAVSTDASYAFTATGSGTYIAQFERNQYAISVTANPSEGGTVTGGGTYTHGSTATIVAASAEDYQFINWTKDGTEVSTSPTFSFVVTEDGDYVANFEPLPLHTITVVQAEGGSIEAPASAYATQTVTVTADSSEPGYRLVSLFYYTDDPDDATAIDIQTKQFVMPFADITLSGVFRHFEMGDVNLDGDVNILDVLATLNFILGNDVGFDLEFGDMNGDGVIDISDALAINASILGLKDNCGELTATYSIVNGKLYIDSEVALAGYQFNLSSEPTVLDMPGFSVRGNWVNGEYILLVYSLDSEKEPGFYAILDLGGTDVSGITMATKEGCSVRGEEGTVGVGSIDEDRYSVYPIPAHDEVTVEGPSIQSVEMFNPLGQLVKRIANVNADRTVINVNDLSAGSYLFRIHTANGSFVKNVILK